MTIEHRAKARAVVALGTSRFRGWSLNVEQAASLGKTPIEDSIWEIPPAFSFASCEGIENRPAFRDAFERRLCIVPVNNFYEWKKTASGKQPYAVALAKGGLMALAGLWENWRSPAGEWLRSFAVITTSPNELCAELHNRMPVVLGPETWPLWLGEEPADPGELKALLAPYPSERMTCWPVSVRVGNVKNNDPSLIEPTAAG